MANVIKVLVVEDHNIQQKIIKVILAGLGYMVDIAENGKKALELFKKNQYDFIFMDIGLPDINGIEVTKQIRKMENNLSRVPIVALTANYDEAYKPLFLDAGMDDFMLKPLEKFSGKSVIDKFIRKKIRT